MRTDLKVCILSMQQVDNFGSVIQSYCLKKILESLQCNVSFIDIQPNKEQFDEVEKYNDSTFQEEEKHNQNIVLRRLSKLDRYFINRFKNRQLFKEQSKKFSQFRKNILNISNLDNEKHYDYCVIGSDEMFNCMQKSSWGFTSQMFGDVTQADRSFTYAVSCGGTKIEMVPPYVKQEISNALSKLSGISVRDKNTYTFVQTLCDSKINMHYDPAIIYDLDSEINKIDLSYLHLPKKVCLVYSYPDRIHDRKYINNIQRFAKMNDMHIVSAGYGQPWISDYLCLDPFELVALFKYAEFVITDTFHGTIFSMKYAKHFSVKVQESNTNKLTDLVEKFDLQEHITQNFENLEHIYRCKENRESILNKCKKGKERSIDYFRNQFQDK